MEKKHLIGKKVRGFKFEPEDYISYNPDMDTFIGKIGTITYIGSKGNIVRVEFPGALREWFYPIDQIEEHIVEDLPSQYEAGMTVYDILHEGGGNIISIGDSEMYPVKVDFGGDISTYTKDGRNTITARYPLLSLTPYDLVNGGATFPTFKPKVPEIEKGTLVYVRDDPGKGYWEMRFFSHFDDSGRIHCFRYQEKEGKALPWDEYSLTNPLIEEKQ